MGTGLIFAAVVAIWAAYFVPLALRRYDEAARAGSIDSFSGAMRVLAHRERPEERPIERSEEPPQGRAEHPRPAVTRASARTAARRRRRTLLTLLAGVVVVGALAAFAVLPPWSVAAPVALVLAWLVACRVQVRGERGLGERRRAKRATRQAARAQRRAARARKRARAGARPAKRPGHGAGGQSAERSDQRADLFVGDDEATVVISAPVDDYDPHRKHVMETAPLDDEDLLEVETAAVPVSSPTGATLWDPVPVTLPTYVGKPRAARTIRTIEFGEPGAWTSGHVEGEDTDVDRPPTPEAEQRRAVGD